MTSSAGYERELMEELESKGWICHRVAGSGKNYTAVCDVVALKKGKARLVEVKAAKRVYYTSNDRLQLKELIRVARKCGATPTLAVRIKGKKEWKFVNLLKEFPLKVG